MDITPAKPDNTKLTGFERRLLQALVDFHQQHRQSPTIAEIAQALGVRSRGTVHRYLRSLEEKGYLQRKGRGWRNLSLAPEAVVYVQTEVQMQSEPASKALANANSANDKNTVVPFKNTGRSSKVAEPDPDQDYRIPFLGKIAAGMPIEAISNEDHLDLAGFFIGPGRFALRVTGDSMMEAGILDGDTVIVKQQSTARAGDIVVALIDQQEATLKRLGSQSGDCVELIPENHTMTVMRYSSSRVAIQGVVVGQLRSY